MSKHAEDEGWGIQQDGTGYKVTWGPYGDRTLSTPVLNRADALALAKLASDRDELLDALKEVLDILSTYLPQATGTRKTIARAIAKAEGK